MRSRADSKLEQDAGGRPFIRPWSPLADVRWRKVAQPGRLSGAGPGNRIQQTISKKTHTQRQVLLSPVPCVERSVYRGRRRDQYERERSREGILRLVRLGNGQPPDRRAGGLEATGKGTALEGSRAGGSSARFPGGPNKLCPTFKRASCPFAWSLASPVGAVSERDTRSHWVPATPSQREPPNSVLGRAPVQPELPARCLIGPAASLPILAILERPRGPILYAPRWISPCTACRCVPLCHYSVPSATWVPRF